jgi:hypothetical protein
VAQSDRRAPVRPDALPAGDQRALSGASVPGLRGRPLL